MGVELQIKRAILGGLVVRAAQRRLRSICFPAVGPMFVDHINAAGAPGFQQAGAAVLMHVPLDVFLVRRDDVLAGGAPPGASHPAGRATLNVQLAVEGTALVMRCVGADIGPLGAAVPGAGEAIGNAVGVVGQFDLSRVLTALEMGAPGSARIELPGDVIAARFEPAGPAAARLIEGDDWGVFLDATGMERLAMAKLAPVRNALASFMTSLSITPQWHPTGPLPHLDIRFSGKAHVPDPFAGNVAGVLGCDFGLTGPSIDVLRATVHWSLELDLGTFVPDALENLLIRLFSDHLDPTKFGAIPVGPRTFAFDRQLPPLQAAVGARFEYANLPAFPDGMLLGGGVYGIERMNTDTIRISVDTFGEDPVTMVFCSQGAIDATPPPPGEGECSATAILRGIGAFCDAELISPPGDTIEPYVTWPRPGTVGEEAKITVDLPAEVAREVRGPVLVLVRTARGARLINFGSTPLPPPTGPVVIEDPLIDTEHIMLVPTPIFIDDCLHERPVPETKEEWERWLEEQQEMAWHPDETQVTGPERVTEWAGHVRGQKTITTQLVTVTELQPGELLQFRSRDHSVDVTAGPDGRAVVPVLYPSERARVEARIGRVNRQSLKGHLQVRSVVFQRGGHVPAGLRNRLTGAADGAAMLTAEFADRTEVHELSRRGLRQLASGSEPAPPPDPASADADPAPEADPAGYPAGLGGVTALIPLPGFDDEPVRIAELVDGTRLVLDLGTAGGAPRVAGTFSGPIGTLDTAGDWAIATDNDQVTIFRVHRS